MSLVSINDVLKITTKVEKIHPYKVVGDRESYSPYNEGWSDCVSLIEHYLEKLPSAEPEQQKGRWIYDTERVWHDGGIYAQYHCSECRFQIIGSLYNYCPFCGADMR